MPKIERSKMLAIARLLAYVILVAATAASFVLVIHSLNNITNERTVRIAEINTALMDDCKNGNKLRTKLRNFIGQNFEADKLQYQFYIKNHTFPLYVIQNAERLSSHELKIFQISFANLKCTGLPKSLTRGAK